jgi:ATP-binding cassette, subfamily B, bacterial
MTTISGSTRPRLSAWNTLRRGLAISPEFRAGLPMTLLLAAVSTGGRVLVPVAVQQTVDGGLLGAGGPDPGRVRASVLLAGVAVLMPPTCSTSGCSGPRRAGWPACGCARSVTSTTCRC